MVSKHTQNKIKKDPIDLTFDIIGKKFTIQILRNILYYEHVRFNEFLNSIRGVSPRILSSRLKEMEENNLIQRIVYNDVPVRIEYHVTSKGKKLMPILDQMAIFSLKHYNKEIFKDKKPRTFRQVYGRSPKN